MSLLTITCPHCGFSKEIDRERIPAAVSSIKCPKCQQSFPLLRQDEALTFQLETEPPVAASAASAVAASAAVGSAAPFKDCPFCAQPIAPRAEICPHCGVRVAASGRAVSKVALLLITFFLGGMGGHKFYQKKYGLGVLYLLFFWTYIPGLVALIEFIIYCTKSEAELQQAYPEASNLALVFVLVGFVFIVIIGILAAIAIPQFAAYRQKGFDAAARNDLKNCRTQVEVYFFENSAYPTAVGQFECQASPNVALYYLAVDSTAYQLISFHNNGRTAFLQESDSLELSENSKDEIEQQINENFGPDALARTFHFIE